MVVFALLVLLFALQIPGSSIFFRPVRQAPAAPRTAFVTLSDAAYSKVMRQLRTADWSKPFRHGSDSALDQGPGVAGLDETLPPAEGLPLAEGFTPAPAPGVQPLPQLRPSLKPPSLAAPMRTASPPPAKAPDPGRKDAELLDLEAFETLKER